MKGSWFFLLILLFSFTAQITAGEVCPPWFIPDNTSNTGCSCHDFHKGVRCSAVTNFFRLPITTSWFCLTYNSSAKITEYGPCPYIAHYNNVTSVDHVFYIQLPSNVSLLNEFMCGLLNREGPLCGKCKDNYGIVLYSYTLKCSKCWGHGYGWVLYWALELFPITVMYFLVVIFHIRVTSSPLSAIVFMSQIVLHNTSERTLAYVH